MANLYRRPFYLFLLAGLAFQTGCNGCATPHTNVTPERIEEIKTDESLSDSETIKQLAAAVFRTTFGDVVSANRNKTGGYTALVWIKQWQHEDFPQESTFLLNPAAIDEETRELMQAIKADAYRRVAVRMDEYVEHLGPRKLDGMVIRLGRSFRKEGVEVTLLQVEIDKDQFTALHEALGDLRVRLYDAEDDDVIATMDQIWNVETDGFPKPTP